MDASKIKKAFRSILMVLLLNVTGVIRLNAYNFSSVCSTGQTLYYTITDDTNHYVEITHPHPIVTTPWGNYEKPTGRLILPETVEYEGVIYSVTSIGRCAFYGCEEITSVTISNSITTIGVFNSVYWETCLGAFQNCTSLSDVSFGSSLTSIGARTFGGCDNLFSIIIPERVTRVGFFAFEDCGWYNEQPDGILYLSNCCLGYKGPKPTGSLSLLDGTRLIADVAFATCHELTGTLVIPNSVEIIGNHAFSYSPTETFYPMFTSLRLGNSVTAIGDWAFASVPFQGELELPSSLKSIGNGVFHYCTGFTGDLVIPDAVTTIGGGAFWRCSGFNGDLIIGNSVNTIGPGAFDGCSGFTGNLVIGEATITIEGEAFKDCSGLIGDLAIPSSVTTIGISAFQDCSGFTGNLQLPNSLIVIGGAAFSGCHGLTGGLVIPNSVTTIGGNAFNGCYGLTGELVIPASVTTIGYGAFSGCHGFAGEINIPVSVTQLGGAVFFDCGNFNRIEYHAQNLVYDSNWQTHPPFEGCNYSLFIGNEVESIPAFLFSDGGLVGDIIIPNSVIEINKNAFQNCAGLSSVVFPNFLVSIGNNAFENCERLESVTIPSTMQQIGTRAFANCTSLQTINYNAANCNILDKWLEGCTAFNALNIGNNVESIPSNSFSDCVSLSSVVLPESITSIGNNAFFGCTGLTSINIPSLVNHIGSNAFNGCQNLLSIVLPRFLDYLGASAFRNCSRLTNIYYQVEQNLDSGITPFMNCPNLTTIHVDPHVLEIGSEVFRGCLTVHFIVALGETPAVLEVGAFEDIKESAIVMVSCGNRINYYSNWNMFSFNNIIEDCDTYGINVGVVGNGGSVSSSVSEAQMGQVVQLTVMPNSGMSLSSLKVSNVNDPSQIVPVSPSGKTVSTFEFTMPPFEVLVMATFTANTSVNENTIANISVCVYPNPTTGYIMIESKSIIKHVTISNTLGQILYDGVCNSSSFEYDFGKHGLGLYLIRMETEHGVCVKEVSVGR